MSLILTLKGRVPSKKNSRQFITRGKRFLSVPSENYRTWHDDHLWLLKGTPPQGEGPFKILINIYAENERGFDGDNVLTSVLDLLKDCKIVSDDNVKVVSQGGWEYMGVDRANPRVMVTISDPD